MMTSDIKRDVKDSTIDLVSGIAGGIAFVYSSQPLDTCKVKLQAFPMSYKHAYQCLTHTAKYEGIRGLYAGSVPSLIAHTLEFSILFFAYSGMKKVIKNILGLPYSQNMDSVHYATSGSIAAVLSSIVTCPTDVVKARLQLLLADRAESKIGMKLLIRAEKQRLYTDKLKQNPEWVEKEKKKHL
ncbi:unnamed protein product [Callosobruchus maculatus]|uniref:Mitochondrial carrier protein n=1 Tax=Callosobruchus maculatus TaxID=64391 RepID=A0A653BGI4_CALMS|nr:unnamed protein product [Callosobruchus maculatus]